MNSLRLFRQRWVALICVGLLGVVISCLAFVVAKAADDRRVGHELESRAEWRARDLEAKIRLSGNAVESVSIAMSANPALTPDEFELIAIRASRDLEHVNSLQWAPRVRPADIPAFEDEARALGMANYTVFDVTPDFLRTELTARDEYFPVLYEMRSHGNRHAQGLALGKYDGRRIPMQNAQDSGRPVATLPVRPIGPPTPTLVYLLFWPIYDGIDVPATVEGRRAGLRGFAVGNYNVAELLNAALRDTPAPIETIHFSIGSAHWDAPLDSVAASFSPDTGVVAVADAVMPGETPALRIQRDFTVFGQHWDLTFDYSAAAVLPLRSATAWSWLLAGLLLTTALVLYLLRERGRTESIEAQVVERTAELERTNEQLHQAQKMEAIGNMTGGMAHDFNNLLAVMVGNLELLQDRLGNDSRGVALADAALQAGMRGAELTRQLLAFARRQPLKPSITDVNELVVGMTRLLERILEENIEIALITAPEVWPVTIDPAQLSSAIANLATNARDAMPRGGRLTIETMNTHLDEDYAARNPEVVPGDFVLIEVSDTGTGIAAETLPHVFEPFFTTKEVGRGTGLGLSMVFGFVKQSQGHIKIYSELGQGTTVRLYLRRAASGIQAPLSAPIAAAPQRGHETILVVEDDAAVRATVIRQLGDLGYRVAEADRAEAALALLRNPAVAVDLLFTDLVMPGGMNGHELARAALAERPGLKILYTSGYPGSTLRGDERLKEGEHFLSKPYRRQELARKLDEIFDR